MKNNNKYSRWPGWLQDVLGLRIHTKVSPGIALIMWALLLLAYILFIMNWIMVINLGGTKEDSSYINGWILKFFGVEGANNTTSQAVSYVITLFRGLASFSIGWIMVKLSHKWAVLVAMVLLAAALPAVYSNGYVGFIIGRAFMALGGTMMIIFLQPVISRFFKPKAKAYLSMVSVQGYVIGSLISFGVFLNAEVSKMLLQDWRSTSAIIGGLTLIPLVLYFLFARNFEFNTKSEATENDKELKPATYWAVLKDRDTIVFSLLYGFWLIVAVLITAYVPTLLQNANPYLKTFVFEGGFKIPWKALFGFVFFVCGILGMVISYWTRFHLRRKPILIFLSVLKVIALILIILGATFGMVWLTIASMAFLGFMVFGYQGILFYVPHEYKGQSPRRMTIFFGYVWGFGYIIYTISNIITALLNDYWSPWAGIGFVVIIFVVTLVMNFFIREPKPDAPWFPRLMSRRSSQSKELLKN